MGFGCHVLTLNQTYCHFRGIIDKQTMKYNFLALV